MRGSSLFSDSENGKILKKERKKNCESEGVLIEPSSNSRGSVLVE